MSEGSRGQASDDPIEVLLVEDNPGDIRFVEEALETTAYDVTLHTATDGYEALHFLRQETASDTPALPDLALVDLDVPGKDGCEILKSIREDPQLRRLPVIIFSGSVAHSDVARCYDAFANAYITKPTDPGEFVSVIETILQFWFERAQLPPMP